MSKIKEQLYETVYIVRPDLTEDLSKKVNEKIGEVVKRFQGQISAQRDLGKKQLAYCIAKHTKGHYFQLNFKGSGQVIEELERHLRLSEDVIRFLTVRDPGLQQTTQQEVPV
jgi:small subunit ribosomal protein S6